MSRLRQTVARRLKDAQNTAAILTTFNDVDMSAVMEARSRYRDLFEKKHGIRLGFMAFFVKACALAAKDVPAVNGSIEGDEIIYHDYFDVSIAVSAPKGLVVPVVRNAQALSFADIEKTIADYGKRAKEGNIEAVDEQLTLLKELKKPTVFTTELASIRLHATQAARQGKNRAAELRIAKLCEDANAVISAYMNPDRTRQLEEEVSGLREVARENQDALKGVGKKMAPTTRPAVPKPAPAPPKPAPKPVPKPMPGF